MHAITAEPGVYELTRDEGREFLEEKTLRELGMTLAEFEESYRTGRLDFDRPETMELVLLLPFAR
ncbi:MAG: hypothetical protein ACRDPK_03535 [Carbonactinosporaceae bacterium]